MVKLLTLTKRSLLKTFACWPPRLQRTGFPALYLPLMLSIHFDCQQAETQIERLAISETLDGEPVATNLHDCHLSRVTAVKQNSVQLNECVKDMDEQYMK